MNRTVKNVRITFWIVTFAIGLLLFAAARADVPDFKVNADGTSAEQSQPRIAVAADGTFVVVWRDKRNGNSDIYLQRYQSDGSPIGGNQRLNDDTGDAFQAEPAIGVDYAGRFMTAWRDFRDGVYPFDPSIYMQILDPDLNGVGANALLATGLPDTLKEAPDIALAPWGDGVVVWADYRNGNWDIFGQRFDAGGNALGESFMVNDDGVLGQQHAPRVAVSPDGWFVVAWYDNRWGDDDIFVQRYDITGQPVGANIRINTDAGGKRQAFPAVTADGNGHFTVVWVDWRDGAYPADPDIYMKKYDTLLVAKTTDTRVNRDGTTAAQRDPAISADRSGNVAIIWADSSSGSWNIVGQMIDVDGVIREATFQANIEGNSAQFQPDIALDGRYRYTAWADRRDGQLDIFASIQEYNNPSLVPEPVAVSFAMERGDELPATQLVTLDHTGYSQIDFEIEENLAWLAVSPGSGTTPDTLSVEVTDSTLPEGSYAGVVVIRDVIDSTIAAELSVALLVRGVSNELPDTVVFGSAMLAPGESGSVAVNITLTRAAQSLRIPIQYADSSWVVDSIHPGSISDSIVVTESFIHDDAADTWQIVFTATDSIPAGAYHLSSLFITAGAGTGNFSVDVPAGDSGWAVDMSGDTIGSISVPGQIVVDISTDASGDDDILMPEAVSLSQNYPNPFNPSTSFHIYLPRQADVLLEVYNILGQRVSVLAEGRLATGRHLMSWDGQAGDGRPAPSGIYFYRLTAGETSLVRKMVLVK